MGFRRPLAFLVTIAATAQITVALSAPPAKTAIAAPASSSGGAGQAGASGAAQKAFAELEAVPTKPGDPKAGQGKAAACGACHGADGNSTDPQYPKLAGQNEAYIATQLMRFKSGVRANVIMSGMAASLSPQDMRDIGAYFAEQKSLPGVADEATVKAGQKLFREGDAARGVPACMACHGPDGRGNPGVPFPQLAGQHADYVQKQLQAWHDGASWGSDPHAQIMPTIAQRLTEADIAAVSSYVEGLHTAPAPGTPTAVPASSVAKAAPTLSSSAATVSGARAAPGTPAPASTQH
jgi:cytochrome c553